MTEHVLDDVAVGAAEDALLVQQLERAAAGSLRKAAVLLHVKAKCGGERLDRLDAANGRAGEPSRSEERRVGKECRSRGARDRYKKRTQRREDRDVDAEGT